MTIYKEPNPLPKGVVDDETDVLRSRQRVAYVRLRIERIRIILT